MTMRVRAVAAGGLLLALLCGCTTTEDANLAMKSRWVGRTSDAFFTQHGAPLRSFALDDGGTLYSWRGGQKTQFIPAQYSTRSDPAESRTTTTTVVGPGGPVVTETRTRSEYEEPVMTAPAREELLYCEAQIAADPDGIIRNIEATNDTTGAGLSLSRCAEVFGVE